MEQPTSYHEFWPYYVREHVHPRTRLLHFLGTGGVIVLAALAAVLADGWVLLAMPVCGYGFAWFAHAFVEQNRPATFTHPIWSLMGDFHMFWMMLTRRMDAEVERYKQGPRLDDLPK